MDHRMAGTPAMHLLFTGLPALALLESVGKSPTERSEFKYDIVRYPSGHRCKYLPFVGLNKIPSTCTSYD